MAATLALPAAASPTPPADAARGTANLCEAAALRASQAEGVPLDLLRAISLAESGRRLDGALAPWPWTVNMEGEGRWFSDPQSLLKWVRSRQAEGARSFDLGCFQVNHLWHGENFAGLEQMLDPVENALYAARFLKALMAETGSWETAAGHYHSRTPEFADRYRARVLALMDDAPPAPDLSGTRLAALPAEAPDAPRQPPQWFLASIAPGARTSGPRGGDSAMASLARAWLSASAEESSAAPSGGGLLRRARPLFGSN